MADVLTVEYCSVGFADGVCSVTEGFGSESGTCLVMVSRWLLNIYCLFHITCGGNVAPMCVEEWMPLVGRQIGWVTGSLGERADALGGRAGALHGREIAL